MIHTVKGFGIVNKAEVDVFQELSCFFNNPMNVVNSISGSSAFSKTSLTIWKFMRAADGIQRAAERSYPTSEVRGRSREDPMPEGRWPRGVTPCPRSGAIAKSARL